MATPLQLWLEKKTYLEQQLAITSDHQKVVLREKINECDKEIARLQSQGSQSNEANTTDNQTNNPINSTQNGQATNPTSGQEQPIIALDKVPVLLGLL